MHEAAKPHASSHPRQRPRETARGRQHSGHLQGSKCSLCQGNPGSALSPNLLRTISQILLTRYP